MQIKSKLRDYEIIFEKEIAFIRELINKDYSMVVVDSNVHRLYEQLFTIDAARLIVIEATESNKIIDTVLDICEKLTEIPAKRNATLISIGGGIIQDITGFVANITYRGINWIFVPTTLLAACDSCIGGKTSLNYKKYKNLFGTFYPPTEIHICPEIFKTLTDRDFKSGLGEVVKFNIMMGLAGLENMEQDMENLLSRNPETVSRYVETSLAFKKKYIEIDEFDRGERIKLNFAHTFGHAIEVITAYEIPHGTAVAIGMIMANRVSASRGILNKNIVARSEGVLLEVIDIDVNLLDAPIEDYIAAIRKDKKQTSTSLTAVLIDSYCDTANLSIVRNITESEVADAIQYFINLYKGSPSGGAVSVAD